MALGRRVEDGKIIEPVVDFDFCFLEVASLSLIADHRAASVHSQMQGQGPDFGDVSEPLREFPERDGRYLCKITPEVKRDCMYDDTIVSGVVVTVAAKVASSIFDGATLELRVRSESLRQCFLVKGTRNALHPPYMTSHCRVTEINARKVRCVE